MNPNVNTSLDRRAEELLDAAMRCDTDERDRFLIEECGPDETLLNEARSLLKALQEAPEEFLALTTHIDGEDAANLFQFPGCTSHQGASVTAEERDQRIGPYQLVQRLGEGGFGTVWLASQELPVRRQVALKIVKPGMDTREVVARFEQERQALALMEHPNIAKVLDAGTTEAGRPYFVMELVRGVPVTEFCDSRQLDARARLALFSDVCAAISHAHQKGVIHRDIKPSNVMVTTIGEKPMVKVIDFGIAKAISGPLTDRTLFTHHEQVMGTPTYMSPEQAGSGGQDIDTRTDIYGLGVLLYELLTGKPPFEAKTLAAHGYQEMLRIIREVEPPRPSARLSSLSDQERTHLANTHQTIPAKVDRLVVPDLDWIVMKAIEKDRSRRYETVNGLIADIERHLSHEPVHARPPSAAYRFGRLVRRHRTAFVAGSLVVISLMAGTIVASWQAIQAKHASQAAEMARRHAEASRVEAQQEAEQRRRLLVEASSLSHQAAMSRLKEAHRGDGRVPEALAYLSRALAFDPTNSAAQATAQLALTGEGRALGPRVPERTFHSDCLLCLSPDGRYLATVDETKEEEGIRIESIAGEVPARMVKGIKGKIRQVTFAPDSLKLLVALETGKAVLWDTMTGSPIGAIMDTSPVLEQQFSPDGRWLATMGDNHKARLWDATTGLPVSPWLESDREAGMLSFSPDGQTLMTASCLGRTARFWQVPGGASSGEPVVLKGLMDAVCFSPDGQAVVTAERWGSIQAWRGDHNQPQAVAQHSMFVRTLKFTADGRWLVSACSAPEALLIDMSRPSAPPVRLAHEGKVEDADFSPDGLMVATASEDGTVRVWETATGKALCEPLPHPATVGQVCFSAHGDWIVTRSYDRVIRVWPVLGTPLPGRLLPSKNNRPLLTTLVQSDVGRKLDHSEIIGAYQLLTHDAASGLPLSPAARDGQLTLSPDGTTLLAESGSRDPLTSDGRLWRMSDGFLMGHAVCPVDTIPTASRFSRDSSLLVVQGYDRKIKSDTLRAFSTADGRLLHDLEIPASLREFAIAPDGSRLVALNTLRGFQIFSLPALKPLLKSWTRPQSKYGMFNTVEFSPDGTRFLTSSDHSHAAEVWDARTGQRIGEPMVHDSEVNQASYSADGTLIVTASSDHTVRVWDAATLNPKGPVLHHPSAVMSAAISQDRQWILSSTTSYYTPGTSFLWDARSGRLVRHLQTSRQCVFGARQGWLGLANDADFRALELPRIKSESDPRIALLLDLQAGLHFDSLGRLMPLTEQETSEILDKLKRDASSTEIASLSWALDNPRTRRVTPHDEVTVADLVESYVTESSVSVSTRMPDFLIEAWRLDPLHPLVHVAMAAFTKNTDSVRVLRNHGILHRLLASGNEMLYGRERWARYARSNVRLLLATAKPDAETLSLASAALTLAEKLEPSHPDLPSLREQMGKIAPPVPPVSRP